MSWLNDLYPERPNPVGVLPKWSFSDWATIKDLPYLVYAARVLGKERAPTPAAARGVAIHEALENYALRGTMDYNEHVTERVTAKGRAAIDRLRAHNFQPERRFTLDRDWKECPEDDKWMTAIMDGLAISPDGTHAEVIDYKTGKQYAIKHTQQAQLYAAVVHKVLGIDTVTTRFIYLDSPADDDLAITHNKSMLAAAYAFWNAQGIETTSLPKAAFAPPDVLAGIPKWYYDFLLNPDNYDDAHFPPPYYVLKRRT